MAGWRHTLAPSPECRNTILLMCPVKGINGFPKNIRELVRIRRIRLLYNFGLLSTTRSSRHLCWNKMDNLTPEREIHHLVMRVIVIRSHVIAWKS